MAATMDDENGLPGTHPKKWPPGEALTGYYIRRWESQRMAKKAAVLGFRATAETAPCIAFSRKMGIDALEMAELVARRLNFRVADRQLMEEIANQANISQKASAFFDERFPGYVDRTLKYLFGEKAFIDSDYARHLIGAVYAIAGLEPTVFVGRGVHLILPRERVLAVRCICSDAYRIQRLAEVMRIGPEEAKRRLATIDREQAAFFKKVFDKKDASPYEFDVVVNVDHFGNPADIAEIVCLAFQKKFGSAT